MGREIEVFESREQWRSSLVGVKKPIVEVVDDTNLFGMERPDTASLTELKMNNLL